MVVSSKIDVYYRKRFQEVTKINRFCKKLTAFNHTKYIILHYML